MTASENKPRLGFWRNEFSLFETIDSDKTVNQWYLKPTWNAGNGKWERLSRLNPKRGNLCVRIGKLRSFNGDASKSLVERYDQQ